MSYVYKKKMNMTREGTIINKSMPISNRNLKRIIS